jgi:hypothetical protein
MPNKPGYATECPECMLERCLPPQDIKTPLDDLLEYINRNPVYITVEGQAIQYISKRRVALVSRLRDLTGTNGSKLNQETIKRIHDAYVAAVEGCVD